MYKMRTRFGTKLIAMNDSFKEMVRNKEMLSATAFIADQTPQPKTAHWMQFLNQESPVFLGAEKIATKMKRIILFVSVQKEKRGYYKIVVNEKDIIDPNEYDLEGEVTELHTRKLERDIIQQPETWLWTHRRWKHKRTVK
jgi:KDO2-lipid IV(A) lauroyltransferase